MKTLILFLILLPTAHADNFRIYSNGMNCFQDRNGYTYGCSGGAMRRGENYMDVETGQLIHQIDRNNALNLDTGRLLTTPGMPFRDDDSIDED